MQASLDCSGITQRWIKASSERAKFYKATLEMCGIAEDTSDSHNDLSESRLGHPLPLMYRMMCCVQRMWEKLRGRRL